MTKWTHDTFAPTPLHRLPTSRFDAYALPVVLLLVTVLFGMVAWGLVRGYNDVYAGEQGRTVTVTTVEGA